MQNNIYIDIVDKAIPATLTQCIRNKITKEMIANMYSPHTANIADIEFADDDSISTLHAEKLSNRINISKYLNSVFIVYTADIFLKSAIV